jgi:plastocyanin
VPVPKTLFAVPLLAVGVLLPGAGRTPAQAPAGSVGMEHEEFHVDEVTIHRGDTLTFFNDSHWLHVLGPGQDGRFAGEQGVPSLGGRGAYLSETGDSFTTARWNTPGTYHITCSLHPEMTVTVVVTP